MRALARRPGSVCSLLWVAAFAVWAAPFVKLDGQVHSLYGLLGTSSAWLPHLMFFDAAFAALFFAFRRLRTTYTVTLFVAIAMGLMSIILPYRDTAQPVLLEGYWLGLAVLTLLLASVLYIEARSANLSSWTWVIDRKKVKLGDAPIGFWSMKRLWRPVLVTLPVSLGLCYGIPALLGAAGYRWQFAFITPLAIVTPIPPRVVLRWARVLSR